MTVDPRLFVLTDKPPVLPDMRWLGLINTATVPSGHIHVWYVKMKPALAKQWRENDSVTMTMFTLHGIIDVEVFVPAYPHEPAESTHLITYRTYNSRRERTHG